VSATALREVGDFLSELKDPPETEAERRRLTSTLHALDHALRLVDVLAEGGPSEPSPSFSEDHPVVVLSSDVLRAAHAVGGSIISRSALSAQAAPIAWTVAPEVASALAMMAARAGELGALQRDHRATTLAAAASGELTATDAFAQIETIRRITRITHHAWRSAAHLLGQDGDGEQGGGSQL
jgi:phosphate:Na+ symporter